MRRPLPLLTGPAGLLLTALLTALVAGCAGPSPQRFDSRRPAGDPYALAPQEEFPPATRLWVTRVPAWPQERIAEEVAAISSLVELRPHRTSLELIGPEPAVDAVATYLADRARFADSRVCLELAQVRISPQAWAFEALSSTEGGLFAVGTRAQGRALVATGRPEDGCRVVLLDGGPAAQLRSFDQRAYLAGTSWNGPHLNPDIALVTLGIECSFLPRLAGEGQLLRLELAVERARAVGEDMPVVRVESASGFVSIPVELPRIDERRLAGRFTLRQDEALVLLQAPADAGQDLLATVVTWSLEGPAPPVDRRAPIDPFTPPLPELLPTGVGPPPGTPRPRVGLEPRGRG